MIQNNILTYLYYDTIVFAIYYKGGCAFAAKIDKVMFNDKV
jgi:hypothetical protein